MLPPGKAATLGRREICFGGFLPGGISFRPKLLPGMTAAEDRVGLDSVFGLSYTVRLVSGIRKAPPLWSPAAGAVFRSAYRLDGRCRIPV